MPSNNVSICHVYMYIIREKRRESYNLLVVTCPTQDDTSPAGWRLSIASSDVKLSLANWWRSLTMKPWPKCVNEKGPVSFRDSSSFPDWLQTVLKEWNISVSMFWAHGWSSWLSCRCECGFLPYGKACFNWMPPAHWALASLSTHPSNLICWQIIYRGQFPR